MRAEFKGQPKTQQEGVEKGSDFQLSQLAEKFVTI